MLDPAADSQKIALTCRFVQHDQWLTTHIEPSWSIRQLKLWLVHRLFAIPVPQRIFLPPPSSGKAPERPPSPITFAPDPHTRPASPIIFAPPHRSGFYGGATGRGWLSDTDEELLSGDDSGASSSATLAKKRSRTMTINVGPSGSHSDSEAHIPPTQHPRSPTSTTPAATSPTSAPSANPDVDRFPGGINPSHWTLIRYSTGQLLPDEDLIAWNDIHEFELVELHGPSLPSTHILYEYQVCHLWNPERHLQERERLKGRLTKQFQAEMANPSKYSSSRDKSKDRDKSDGSRAAYHSQVLKALSLDYHTGANLGVIEYYGQRLAKTKVVPPLTRIPRSIDVYVQPYWEGWVRTLRIVYRGNPQEVAFLAAMGGGPDGPSANVGVGGPSSSNARMQDAYKYGTGPAPNAFGMGPQFGYFSPLERNPHPPNPPGSSYPRDSKLVRVEWRERWVKIQNGHLIVLREPNNDDATHVLALKNIVSLMDTHHLVRYLSYSGFNPPLDHPSVNQDILTPAINLPIHRPPRPSHGYFDESSSDESNTRHHRRGAHSSYGPSAHHGVGHHSSGSWPGGGVGGVIAGAGAGSERGGKEYNFDFRDASHLQQHMKARELTPLIGSRFDPTYLPITFDEQKASGLRVVCLQFRKQTTSSTTTTTTTKPPSSSRAGGISNGNRRKSRLEVEEEREKLKEKERARDNVVEPSTLALEDMKERAGEWGGLRSNNPLWKCPSRLRREPAYIYRFKSRMRTRYSRNTPSTSNTTTATSESRIPGAESKSRGSSGSKRTNQDFLSVGGGRSHQHHHHHHHRHQHHRHQSSRKVPGDYRMIQERDAMIAAHILGAISPEERQRKARLKKEKQKEKERLKHEKELREASFGGKEKEKDWKLGSLNVDFWNWGKKKKKARQEKQMRLRMEEHERQIEEHFAAASASAYKVARTPNESSTTIEASMSGTIPSVTAIGSLSGTRSAGPSSDEDGAEFTNWGRGRSETSNVETTEEDEDDEDDASEDDEEEKEVKDVEGDEEEDDGVPEPYSDVIPPGSPLVRDDDEEEEIEYADSPEPSISNADTPSPDEGSESIVTPGPHSVASVVVQVEVDKRVETETETEDGNRRRSRTVTASFGGKAHSRLPSATSVTEEQTRKPVLSEGQPASHRLVGQLHTSDDERKNIGEGQEGDDDSDLSSPIFAAPPSLRQLPVRSQHDARTAGSVSSHRSSTSFDASQEGSTTGDDDTDDDLTFDNEYPDFKRSGYRYGLFNNRKEGEKTRYRREMEEQKAREAKIREQRKLEEREVLLEKERVERDRERKERRKKEEEGEWVCLDLENDFAFGSFLRIVHQHCPHPMKSTFLERMLGQSFNDHPPPSQPSGKNPPTSLQSIVETNDAPEPPTGQESISPPISSMPMPPSTPSITAPSFHSTYSDDSETEYVAPLPGYADPRFQYPSRISATVPYPEWRLNVLRKAQRAGTGDVGRAMEMLYWGREDPVIAGASGVEFQRLARRWEGDRAGVPGFRSYMGGGGKRGNGKGTRRESGSETEDNVSSLGTIGPTTIGSGGTVTGVSVTQQRRMSASGRSMQSATSPKQAVPAVPKEGGDSGNESSGENSDGVISAASSVGGDSGGRKQQKQKKRVSVETRLVDWSDDEDNTSELEWAGWQMDLQRQAKRQYAIQARRDVESMWESDEELADLGLPANPIDDMKRYIKNRYQLEPEARIILGARSRGTDAQTMLSASTQISSTSASLTVSSPLAKVTSSDTLGSQHAGTPSHSSHTLHHSASLHTGLKKDASSLRRPSMPTLNVSVHHENRVEKGKGKERAFWEFAGLGPSNEEPKSPMMPTIKHGWFGGGSSSKDREGLSPGGTSASQAASGSGSMGRSGNILLGRSKLKRKDLSEQERERGKGSEADREARKGQQRPQLRVTTSHPVGSPSSAVGVESIKSPALGNRQLTRIRSDASILSNAEASPPSQTKKKRVMGKLRELADSSIDFAEGK